MRNLEATLLITITLLFFSFGKSVRNIQPDRSDNFVIFSIDNLTATNKNTRLGFYYHDSLAYGHPVAIVGQKTRLLLYSPTLLLEPSARQTPFFVLPGEQINIRYAGSDSVQMYVRGNQQRTDELNFFRKLVQETGNLYYGFTLMPYHKKVKTLNDVHILEKKINTVKNTRLQFLNAFKKCSSISGNFIKIAVNSIESTAFTDSLILYYNNQPLLNNNNLYRHLISEKVSSVKNIGFTPYQIYYRACSMVVSIATANDPNHMVSTYSDFQKRFEFIEKNFTGETRDFLMSNALYTAFTNDVLIPKADLYTYRNLCTNKGYRDIIERTLTTVPVAAYAPGHNNLLLTDGKTVQDMQSVISRYKGKIAVLDFWASWCGPCRAEIPYYKMLKKKYNGRDIVFLSISTDNNTDNWLRAGKEEALNGDDSFLLLNADKSAFVKKYKIFSIPRYLLIDKNGNLIAGDAPRPSDPKLAKLIDKFL